MIQVVLIAIAVHTVIQACLGVALGQPLQALCVAVALPVVLAVCGVVSWVVVETLYKIGVY